MRNGLWPFCSVREGSAARYVFARRGGAYALVGKPFFAQCLGKKILTNGFFSRLAFGLFFGSSFAEPSPVMNCFRFVFFSTLFAMQGCAPEKATINLAGTSDSNAHATSSAAECGCVVAVSSEGDQNAGSMLSAEQEETLVKQTSQKFRNALNVCTFIESAQKKNKEWYRVDERLEWMRTFDVPYSPPPNLLAPINSDFEPVIGADSSIATELCGWASFYKDNYFDPFAKVDNIKKISKQSARLRAYVSIETLGINLFTLRYAPDTFRAVRSKKKQKILVAQTVWRNVMPNFAPRSLYAESLSLNPRALPEFSRCFSGEDGLERNDVRNASLASMALVVAEARVAPYDYVYLFALVTSQAFFKNIDFVDFPTQGLTNDETQKVFWLPGNSYDSFLQKHLPN